MFCRYFPSGVSKANLEDFLCLTLLSLLLILIHGDSNHSEALPILITVTTQKSGNSGALCRIWRQLHRSETLLSPVCWPVSAPSRSLLLLEPWGTKTRWRGHWGAFKGRFSESSKFRFPKSQKVVCSLRLTSLHFIPGENVSALKKLLGNNFEWFYTHFSFIIMTTTESRVSVFYTLFYTM